jgi:hypothetical protein
MLPTRLTLKKAFPFNEPVNKGRVAQAVLPFHQTQDRGATVNATQYVEALGSVSV